MTRQATSKVKLSVSGNLQNVLDDQKVTSSNTLSYSVDHTFTDGFAASECNRLWKIEGTVISGSPDTLVLGADSTVDIGAGAGKDGSGLDWDAEYIVSAIVRCGSSSEGTLDLTAGGFDFLGSPTGIAAGGWVARCIGDEDSAGYTLVSSADLTLTATGGDVEYEIVLVGRSSLESV